tara:strand:- start:478 stop:687 length:210 start_codon:yes stop_codon:yes gene_type:complete
MAGGDQVIDANDTQYWHDLSVDICRVLGADGGFTDGGRHPFIIALVRVATLRERKRLESNAAILESASK